MATADEKSKPAGAIRGWFDFSLYKKTQGKRVRQLTAAGIGLLIVLACREIMLSMAGYGAAWEYGLPTALLVIGAWLTFRIVNNPRFADFLIATEAEMNKVSWSTRDELKRATVVVLVLTLAMTLYLFAWDRVWEFVLTWIGVLNIPAQSEEQAAALGRLISDAWRWV